MTFLKGATNRAAVAALTVATAGAMHFAAPAVGCAFHSTIPETQLGGMYPGSLAVAVALREAADGGEIDRSALEGAASGTLPYIDTTRRLREFGMELAAASVAAEMPPSFSLGFVESGLWTRYSYADGKVGVELHTNGPAEGEAVVLTGEPVLTELRAGGLSLDRAMAEGLIVFDASESETVAIGDALTTTFHGERIGSR